jgi:hypothetical protein
LNRTVGSSFFGCSLRAAAPPFFVAGFADEAFGLLPEFAGGLHETLQSNISPQAAAWRAKSQSGLGIDCLPISLAYF